MIIMEEWIPVELEWVHYRVDAIPIEQENLSFILTSYSKSGLYVVMAQFGYHVSTIYNIFFSNKILRRNKDNFLLSSIQNSFEVSWIYSQNAIKIYDHKNHILSIHLLIFYALYYHPFISLGFYWLSFCSPCLLFPAEKTAYCLSEKA